MRRCIFPSDLYVIQLKAEASSVIVFIFICVMEMSITDARDQHDRQIFERV
jgi:hypothetical protein